MSEEEQISPEEKLLKVIQEPEAAAQPTTDDGPQTTEPTLKAEAKPAETAEKPIADAQDKPKLELKQTTGGEVADQSQQAEPAIAEAGIKLGVGVEVPAEAAGKIGADNVLVEDKKKSTGKLGIRTINKYLVAAAIIVLCFVAWEAVSYQISAPEPVELVFIDDPLPAGGNMNQNIGDSGEGLADMQKVLSAFLKKPIFIFPETKIRQEGPRLGPRAPVIYVDWAKYAKTNFKMKGRSRLPGDAGYMAVVSDGLTRKMHFLKVDDKVMIEKLIVQVKEVGAGFVKFSDGSVEMTVE